MLVNEHARELTGVTFLGAASVNVCVCVCVCVCKIVNFSSRISLRNTRHLPTVVFHDYKIRMCCLSHLVIHECLCEERLNSSPNNLFDTRVGNHTTQEPLEVISWQSVKGHCQPRLTTTSMSGERSTMSLLLSVFWLCFCLFTGEFAGEIRESPRICTAKAHWPL